LSVIKHAWYGGVIRIRKAVTRFKEGGSQTRPVVDSNAISFVTGAHKARPRMVWASPRTVENAMFWRNALVASQYYKANREICQVARSRNSHGKEITARPDGPDSGSVQQCMYPRKNTKKRRCKRYQSCTYLVSASAKFFVVANGNWLSTERIKIILAEGSRRRRRFHLKGLVPHRFLVHSVGCGFQPLLQGLCHTRGTRRSVQSPLMGRYNLLRLRHKRREAMISYATTSLS
jgi:hypothetical protein